MVVEAGDVRRVEVDVRLAVRHPLRERLADARPLLDPHSGGRPQPFHLGRLAEDRHPVGRQRDEAVDCVLHSDRLVADDLRHQVERVGELGIEVRLRERELGRRERRRLDRGDLLGVVDDRAVRVRADLETRSVLPLVHEHVHVADDRELDRARARLEARHGPDVDHLVHHRRERDVRARHPGEERAPDAAGNYDRLRLDRPARGVDASDAAALDVHRGDLGVGQHRERAGLDRAFAHQRPGPERVDDRHRRAVEPSEQDRLVDVGDELLDLCRRHQPRRVDAPGLRGRHPAP